MRPVGAQPVISMAGRVARSRKTGMNNSDSFQSMDQLLQAMGLPGDTQMRVATPPSGVSLEDRSRDYPIRSSSNRSPTALQKQFSWEKCGPDARLTRGKVGLGAIAEMGS